jgi:uncharacterized protein
MGQSWLDLLFVHWPVERSVLDRLVPRPLEVERYEGDAWIGVTPFVVEALRIAPFPPIPVLSSFPELNVRTYVRYRDKPGIWFFSLDAASRFAVAGARRFYKLPYYRASMRARRRATHVEYRCERTDPRGDPARFTGSYAPAGEVASPAESSLEHFLTERYCLYSRAREGSILRAEIHHRPWPLQAAEAEIEVNTMFPAGLPRPAARPVLHYASRQDVLVWGPEPAEG